jgi:hypothetical protein
VRQHVDTIGIILVVWGAIQLVSTLLLGLFVGIYGGLGAIMALAGISEGDEDLMIGGLFVGGFSLIFLLPMLFMLISALLPTIGGYGVLKRKPWARPVALVGAALSMLQWFPVGAIIAVFTILVLVDSEVAAEFASDADVPKF